MKKLRKFIASAVLICFVPGQVGASVPPAQTEVRLPVSEFAISLPHELGKIERVHSGSGPALIHIQGAHGNYEAEQKISGILHYLKDRYGFETVLLEGTSFEPSRDRINFFPDDKKLTLRTIDLLIRKALMKGSELFLLQEKDAKGYGIENLEAYVRNGKAFKAVLTENRNSENFLNEFEELIERFAGTYLNKELRTFVRETRRLETLELSSGSFDYLMKAARARLDLKLLNPESQFEWPMMARFARMRWIEKKLDHAALETEAQRFIEAVKDPSVKKDARFLLENPGAPGWNAERGRAFLEALAGSLPADFPFGEFLNVRFALALEIFRLELDPSAFFKETERLKEAVAEKLIQSPEEREIYTAYSHYQLLKKLLHLEITPAEYEQILKLKSELRPDEILRRFSEIEKDGRVKVRDFSRISDIDRLFSLSLEFYAGVKERDGLMLQKVEERLKQTGTRKAVVITGGFHAEPFEEHFAAKGFNYALVTPFIQSGGGRNEYVSAVLQRDFEVKKNTREVPFPYSVERTPAHLEEVGGSYAWYDLQLEKAKEEASATAQKQQADRSEVRTTPLSVFEAELTDAATDVLVREEILKRLTSREARKSGETAAAVPVLAARINNNLLSPRERDSAASILNSISKPSPLTTPGIMEAFEASLDDLIAALGTIDSDAGKVLASIFGNIRLPNRNEEVVRALTGILAETSPTKKRTAIISLKKHGRHAVSALPALTAAYAEFAVAVDAIAEINETEFHEPLPAEVGNAVKSFADEIEKSGIKTVIISGGSGVLTYMILMELKRTRIPDLQIYHLDIDSNALLYFAKAGSTLEDPERLDLLAKGIPGWAEVSKQPFIYADDFFSSGVKQGSLEGLFERGGLNARFMALSHSIFFGNKPNVYAGSGQHEVFSYVAKLGHLVSSELVHREELKKVILNETTLPEFRKHLSAAVNRRLDELAASVRSEARAGEVPDFSAAEEKAASFRAELDRLKNAEQAEVFIRTVQEYENLIFRAYRKTREWERQWEPLVGEFSRIRGAAKSKFSAKPAVETEEVKIKNAWNEIKDKVQVYGSKKLIERASYTWELISGYWMLTLKDAAGVGTEWADCTAASCVGVQTLNKRGIPSTAYALRLPATIQFRPADTRDFSRLSGWSNFETQFSSWKLAPTPETTEYMMGHGVVKTHSGYIVDASDYSFVYSNETPAIWNEKDFPFTPALLNAQSMPQMAYSTADSLSFPLVPAKPDQARFPYTTANQPLQIRRLSPVANFIATLTSQVGLGYLAASREIVFSFNLLYRLYDPNSKVLHVPQSFYLQWAVTPERFFSGEQAEARRVLASGDPDQMLAFFTKRNVKLVMNDNARGDLARSFPAAAGKMREILSAAKEDMPSFLEFISKMPAPPAAVFRRSEMRGAKFEADGSWTYPDTEKVGYSLSGKVFDDDTIEISISKLDKDKRATETAGPILVGRQDADFGKLLEVLARSFEPFSIVEAIKRFHRDENSGQQIQDIFLHVLMVLPALIFTPLHFIFPAIPLLGAAFFKHRIAKKALDGYYEKVTEMVRSNRSELRSSTQPAMSEFSRRVELTERAWFAILSKVYRVRIGYDWQLQEVEGRIQEIIRRSRGTLRTTEDMLAVYVGNTVMNLIQLRQKAETLASGGLDPKDWLSIDDIFQALESMLDILTNEDPRAVRANLAGSPVSWPELASSVQKIQELKALWKRDYAAQIPFKLKEIDERNYETVLSQAVKYGLYDEPRRKALFADLARVLKEGRSVFLGFERARQFEIYKLANLLDLSDDLRLTGIDFSSLFFDPTRVTTTQDSIRPQFSQGYEVALVQRGDQPIYSALRTRDYRRFRSEPGISFPVENAEVLSLAGGQGLPLIEMAPLFKNSRLVLLDANPGNIKKSFARLDAFQNTSSASGNSFQVRLTDARHGFEGIPFSAGHFDFIAMTGRAEYGMSRDDLSRIMRETFRALKPSNGYFLIESDGENFLARYREVIDDLVRARQINFPIEVRNLSPNVLIYISRGTVQAPSVAAEARVTTIPLETDSFIKLNSRGVRFIRMEGTDKKQPLSGEGAQSLQRTIDLMNSPFSPGKFVLEISEDDPDTAFLKLVRSELRAEEGRVIENLVIQGISPRTLGVTPLSRIMTWEPEPQRANPSLVRANDKAAAVAVKVANEQKALEEIWRKIVAKLTNPTEEESGGIDFIEGMLVSIKAMIASGQKKSQEVIRETILNSTVLNIPPIALEILEKELLPALEERDEFLFLSNEEEVKGVSLDRARKLIIDRYQEMVLIRLYQIILNLPYGFRTDNSDVAELQKHLAASRKSELEGEIERILHSLREGNSPRTAVQGSIDRMNRAILELDIAIKAANDAEERTAFKTLRTIAVEQIGYFEKIGTSFDTYNYIYEQKDPEAVKKKKKKEELGRHLDIMKQTAWEYPELQTPGIFKRILFGAVTALARIFGIQVAVSDWFRKDPAFLKLRFEIFIRNEIKKGRPLQYASAKFFAENRELVSKEFWGFLMRYFDLAEYGPAQRKSDNPIIVYAKEIRNESDYNRLIASFQGHGKIVAIVAPKQEGEMRIPHWFIYAKKEGILVLTSLDMRKAGISFEDLSKPEGEEYKGVVDVKQGQFVVNPSEKMQSEMERMGKVYDLMDRYFWSRAKKQSIVGLRTIEYLADETNIDSIEEFNGQDSILQRSGADGIGLFRLEELLTAQPSRTGIELDRVRIQAAISEIVSYPAFRRGKPLVIRLNDVSQDKRPQFLVEGAKGLRGWNMEEVLRNKSGARFYLDPENYPEFYEFGKMQLKAIFAAHLQKKVLRSGIKILFSDVRSAEEMEGLEVLILAAKKEFIEEVTSAASMPKPEAGLEHEDFTLSLSTLDPDKLSAEIDRIPTGYMFEETRVVRDRRGEMIAKAVELQKRRNSKRFFGIGSNDLSRSINSEFYGGKMPLDELNPLLVRDILLIAADAGASDIPVNLEGEWGGSIHMLFFLLALYEMAKVEVAPVAATAQIPELREYARMTFPEDLLAPSPEIEKPLSEFLEQILSPDFNIAQFPVREWQEALAALRLKIESRITGSDDFNYFVQQLEENVPLEEIRVEAPKEEGYAEKIEIGSGQVRETRLYRIGAYAFHTTPNATIIEWLYNHQNVKAVYSKEEAPQTQYQFNFANILSVRIMRNQTMFIEATGPEADVQEFFKMIEDMREIDKMTTTFFPARRSESRAGKKYQESISNGVIKDLGGEAAIVKSRRAMKALTVAANRSEFRSYLGFADNLERLGWKGNRTALAFSFGILALTAAARYAKVYAAELGRLQKEGTRASVIEDNKKLIENFYAVLSRKSQTVRQVFDYRVLPEKAESLEALLAYAIYHPEITYTVVSLVSNTEAAEFQRALNRFSIQKFGAAPRNLKIEGAVSREELVRSVKTRVAAAKIPSGFVSSDPALLEEVHYQARLLRVSGDAKDADLQNAAGIVTAEKILEELPVEFLAEVHAAEDLAVNGYLRTLAAEFRNLAVIMASA